MTIRHLKIFVAVCQTGSVTRAAEELFISQPAVSVAIRELEEHYGQKIFERFSRKLSLTPFGTELYQSALRVVAMFDELETSAKKDKFGNILRVGVGPALGQIMLPGRVRKFKEKHPQTEIFVTIDREKYLKKGLIENQIDFVMAEGVLKDPMIRVIPLIPVPFVVICHKDNPLAQRPVVYAMDLEKENILGRQKGNFLRMSMDNFFAENNISVTPKWESMDNYTLLKGVKANEGISFMHADYVNAAKDPDIKVLNVEGFDAGCHLNVYLHRDKTLTPLMNEFIEFCVSGMESSSPCDTV